MDKTQILIVEDDLDLAEMLQSYFKVQNYEVLTAAWGEEAIQISRDNDVQLIVLDIRLPDIDGYEVCRRLRSQRRTQDTPIIFLTEKRDRVDKLQGLELGVVDYITKPFDIQELRLRVRNAINRANRQSLVNPVTDLPEGPMVQDRIGYLLNDHSDWSILRIRIDSLTRFREMYGFVAADDVLRAVTLMVRNAVREHGNVEDYVGHLEDSDFVVITRVDNVERIKNRVESRVQQSREYFYPLKDRDKARAALEANHLKIDSTILSAATGPFEDLDALLQLLNDPDAVVDTPPIPDPLQTPAKVPFSEKETIESPSIRAEKEASELVVETEIVRDTPASSETTSEDAEEEAAPSQAVEEAPQPVSSDEVEETAQATSTEEDD